MKYLTLMAVAAVALLTVANSPAEARRHYQTQDATITCGDRGCSDYFRYTDPPTAQFAHRERKGHKVKVAKRRNTAPPHQQAMLIDKPQEYVAPEHPGDKLVTRETHEAASGSGLVVSHKTGAKARVAPRYAHLFQSYVDALEEAGASIFYMGGIRAGRCSDGSQHPCGKALDVCQDSRGHVSGLRDCHLPGPSEMVRIAKASGLHEGAVWCNTDYGHAQVTPSGGDCGARGYIGDGKRHYYASMTGKIQMASAESQTRTASAKRHRVLHRHHHHMRMASRR